MEIRRILVTIVEIIALTALPSTAGADALVLIRLEGLFFTDPGAPPDPTMLASESFAFSVTISGSVQWDNVTHAQVPGTADFSRQRSEEHTSELQSQSNLVCRLLLEKKKKKKHKIMY